VSRETRRPRRPGRRLNVGNRYSASILIGGKLRRKQFMTFMEEVYLADLGVDWGVPFPAELRDPAWMPDLLDDAGRLYLMSDQACDGQFADLEEWLRSSEMSYDRHSGVDGGCDRVVEMWRPGMERPLQRWASIEGDALITVGPIIEAHKALRLGHVQIAQDLLDRSVGVLQHIAVLPCFEITD